MTIDISNNDPRVNYTVAAGITQTSFTVPFEFFEDADLNVYVDGVLKTISTDYTVSGGDGSTGTITMTVTGASGGSRVTLTRDITIERVTDFSAGADISRAALNTQLDTLTGIAADLNDLGNRALRVSDDEYVSSASNLTIPDKDSRSGAVLAFNESGHAVAGPTISDTQSLANASADIALLADLQDGTTAINVLTNLADLRFEIYDLGQITSDITAVAAVDSNVSTLAPIVADITTAAGVASNITTVAGISSDVTTAAGIAADISTVAGDSADIQTVADNIGTIAQKATVDEAISFSIALG